MKVRARLLSGLSCGQSSSLARTIFYTGRCTQAEKTFKMKIIQILIFFGVFHSAFGQNANMIIQVNDQLITFEISGIYLKFVDDNGEVESNQVGYIPGELVLSEYVRQKINSDSTKSIVLGFAYSNFEKKKEWHGHYKIELSKRLLDQPYLILNIYDFQNKKYKRWYQYLTDEDYLTELRYPNSGIYVRQR